MSNVNVNKLSAEIADSLKKFTNEVIEEADKTGERIGKDAVRKLKGSSPKGRRGKYAKKWRLKTRHADHSCWQTRIPAGSPS